MIDTDLFVYIHFSNYAYNAFFLPLVNRFVASAAVSEVRSFSAALCQELRDWTHHAQTSLLRFVVDFLYNLTTNSQQIESN